jgi:hypothetical protein
LNFEGCGNNLNHEYVKELKEGQESERQEEVEMGVQRASGYLYHRYGTRSDDADGPLNEEKH